jgi:uncharacterized membrane protein (DUF2068 family)
MEQRPATVRIVAAFLFVATAIAAVVGASLLFPNALLDRLWELNKPGAAALRALGWIAGCFLLLLGVGTCAAAIGLLRRKPWAWWFAVALFTIDCSGDVVSFFVTGDWLRSVSGAVISAAFVYSLVRPRVRRYFGIHRARLTARQST